VVIKKLFAALARSWFFKSLLMRRPEKQDGRLFFAGVL
jgi:hypothetical protein